MSEDSRARDRTAGTAGSVSARATAQSHAEAGMAGLSLDQR